MFEIIFFCINIFTFWKWPEMLVDHIYHIAWTCYYKRGPQEVEEEAGSLLRTLPGGGARK